MTDWEYIVRELNYWLQQIIIKVTLNGSRIYIKYFLNGCRVGGMKYTESITNTKPKEMGNVKKTIYVPQEGKHLNKMEKENQEVTKFEKEAFGRAKDCKMKLRKCK